jgi:hypothetical protein
MPWGSNGFFAAGSTPQPMEFFVGEPEVLEFKPGLWYVCLPIACAVLSATTGLISFVKSGGLVQFALRLLMTGLFAALAVLSTKIPYLLLREDGIAFSRASLRAGKYVQWDSIQGASRPRPNVVALTLSGGRILKLDLRWVSRSDRESLVAALERRLGPLV